jgi:cytochrome P450
VRDSYSGPLSAGATSTTSGIDDDMFSPEAIQDPYSYYGHIRETDPIHWNDQYRVWIVTRFEDVAWVTAHPQVFSSAVTATAEDPYPPIKEEDRAHLQFVRRSIRRRITQTDPPDHTAIRAVLRPFFSQAGIERWREPVRDTMLDLLDRVQDRREMDVMRDFAVPFPLGVICELMQIPKADRSWVRGIAENLLVGPRVGESRMSETASAIRQMTEYLEPLLEQRLTSPGDDLLSAVMAAEKQGVYDREQAMQNTIFLIVAGHETTINMICNGLLAFTQHPDQWDRFRSDTEGLIDSAVEEILRYDPPVQSGERIVAQDVELNGKFIRKGERVRWFINSANHDPAKFQNPDTFDVGRRISAHVAFGRGIHLCLGAPLARMEGKMVFPEFARRFERLTLKSSTLEYKPIADTRSLTELVVTW